MLFRVLFASGGGSATGWFLLHDMGMTDLKEDLAFSWAFFGLGIMLFLAIAVGTLIGWVIGESVASRIGMLLPAQSEEASFRIGDLKRHSSLLSDIIRYTYEADEQWCQGTITYYDSTIIREDRDDILLVVRSWRFNWSWEKIIASPPAVEYKFYVPGRVVI